MLKTKVEVAEELHNDVLKRIVINELDEILMKQVLDKAKHGSKEKLSAMQQYDKLKETMKSNKQLLIYIKRKRTMYENEKDFKEAME